MRISKTEYSANSSGVAASLGAGDEQGQTIGAIESHAEVVETDAAANIGPVAAAIRAALVPHLSQLSRVSETFTDQPHECLSRIPESDFHTLSFSLRPLNREKSNRPLSGDASI